MHKKGKVKDTALHRTLVNKNAQNFATKRLIHDLQEIENDKLPIKNVTARPLSNDLFEWHANIRGPIGTHFEGGVFHLVLKIPESYPHQPPQVELLTNFPHPNVFGTKLCLDMLEPTRGKEGLGWSSAYTIQSVLIQLSSFLFERQYGEDEDKQKRNIQKCIEQANIFNCVHNSCKHGGRLSAWPEFRKDENDEESFRIIDYEEKLFFEKELVCYHTKQDFKTNQLGVGLSISKIPRTGLLKQTSVTLDYISIKAFMKEGIRWSSNNETFTHWLPLYLGPGIYKNSQSAQQQQSQQLLEEEKQQQEKEVSTREVSVNLGRKSLTMIMTNSTNQKKWKPEYILEVFPKMIVTLVYQIMDQKRHPSIRLIRILAHLHANFLLYLEEYPLLYEEIENRLTNFIKEEKCRIKDVTSNLGTLMTYLLVSPKHNFEDLISSYQSEQLDRQVFWISKDIPEMADIKQFDQLDDKRVQLTFSNQSTSYHILCFYKIYLEKVKRQYSTPKSLFQAFEDNFCRLSNKIEDEIQQQAFCILKTVDNYQKYFAFIGQKQKTDKEINEMLKQSILNSLAKKYHGKIDEILTLPSTEEQISKLLNNVSTLMTFYETRTINIKSTSSQQEEETQQKESQQLQQQQQQQQNEMEIEQACQKKGHIIQFKLKQIVTEDQWREACLKRWCWIREALNINQQWSLKDLYHQSVKNLSEGEQVYENKLYTIINRQYREQEIQIEYPERLAPALTWEEFFIKLDIEEFIIYFNENPKFQEFYEKLEIASTKLTALTIPIIDVKNVNSGYYFYTQILTKLKHLKFLVICGLPEQNSILHLKAAKAINKGLNNFIKSGSKLLSISYTNFNLGGNDQEFVEKIFTPLAQISSLEEITFNKTNILTLANAAKSLGTIITNLKNLYSLNLTHNVIQSVQYAKEIADGLMRAKQLRVINIKENTQLSSAGLASICYNLAFSPNLKELIISKCQVNGNFTEVVESIYKLLRITSSLEILEAEYIPSLNPALNKEFWIALGEIKTLKYLNIQGSGIISGHQEMCKAIAFNAKKKGVLDHINLRGCISSIGSLNQFYQYMEISEHDHELWYGDPTKANKMSGNDFNKTYYNNLKSLILDWCNDLASGFNYANFIKYKQVDTYLMMLYARSKNLQSLNLSSVKLQKQDAELLRLSLDPTRPHFCSQIKVLNLSKNNLGKEGATTLSKIFLVNNIIQVLDLSKNQIGVFGGQQIAKSLENNKSLKFLNLFNNKIGFDAALAFKQTFTTNTTLEFVEFGHNRIRNKGIIAISEGIAANDQNKLHSLGFRFNFINEDGIIDFLKILIHNTILKNIYIKNNSINDFGLFQIKNAYDNQKCAIQIDLFDKLKYQDQERLDRTIFLHPLITESRQQIKQFFETQNHCGIIIDIRIRRGPKWPNRNQNPNKFAMIEFADPTSVAKAMNLASRKKAILNGKSFRIYKAGTGTFIYQKKTTKQKQAETSKTNKLKAGEFQADVGFQGREERVRGRGRGRGRGGQRFGRGGKDRRRIV